MDEIETVRTFCSIDCAAQLEQQHRDLSIAAARDQNNEADRNSDDYGICLDCEVDIPKERLEAVQATRCIDCQSYYEAIQARCLK